jgi:(1->4)-alpha-D-glucan 1-alpha-D-glucosylmutase
VQASGPAAGHLVAFDRGAGGVLALATRLPYGLEQSGGWRDTAVELEAAMTDELTGSTFGPGPAALSEVFRAYPVALLVPATGGKS